MKIKNKTRYIIKHIGMGLIPVQFILTFMLLIGLSVFYVAMLVLFFAVLFQIIGFDEPIWFLTDKEEV